MLPLTIKKPLIVSMAFFSIDEIIKKNTSSIKLSYAQSMIRQKILRCSLQLLYYCDNKDDYHLTIVHEKTCSRRPKTNVFNSNTALGTYPILYQVHRSKTYFSNLKHFRRSLLCSKEVLRMEKIYILNTNVLIRDPWQFIRLYNTKSLFP